jgi:hypothetical protein
MLYIKIDTRNRQFRPYLDDGVDDRRGIIDFRIVIKPCNGKEDFDQLANFVIEEIADTVKRISKAMNHVREEF